MTQDFILYATAYYNHRYQAGEIAWHTWSNSLSHIRSFEAFLQGKHMDINEMTPELLQTYKQYCLRQGNQTATVNRKLLPLAMTLKEAQREGIVAPDRWLHLSDIYLSKKTGYRSGESAGESEVVRFLTDGQMAQLVQLYDSLPDSPRRDALEIFLFSFHACGLRVSDIVTLEWHHIHRSDATLRKTMVKTRGSLVIPLSAPALEILDRWEQRGLNRRFVFGLLPEDFDFSDAGALERAVDNRNHSLRVHLNNIGKELGFPFPLGMHVARHTFAVKALNTGRVDVHLISRLLGHSSVTVTEKVYATFLLPTLSNELRTRLSFPEYGVSK